MQITGMIRNSFIDYPGKLSTVLFTQGCNFNCFYCHNRELIQRQNDTYISWDSVKEILKSHANIIDGIVISGGEPTVNKDLPDIIMEIKDIHPYSIKLDTNGSNPAMLAHLINNKLVDYIAIDYKAPFEIYEYICGPCSPVDVRDSILAVKHFEAMGQVDYEVRTTVYPELSFDQMSAMCTQVPVLKRYFLQKYRKPELYLNSAHDRIIKHPHSKEELEGNIVKLRDLQPNIALRY